MALGIKGTIGHVLKKKRGMGVKKSGIIILAFVLFGVFGVGYLSSVQIPAPVKTVSKIVPNEQLPR